MMHKHGLFFELKHFPLFEKLEQCLEKISKVVQTVFGKNFQKHLSELCTSQEVQKKEMIKNGVFTDEHLPFISSKANLYRWKKNPIQQQQKSLVVHIHLFCLCFYAYI